MDANKANEKNTNSKPVEQRAKPNYRRHGEVLAESLGIFACDLHSKYTSKIWIRALVLKGESKGNPSKLRESLFVQSLLEGLIILLHSGPIAPKCKKM